MDQLTYLISFENTSPAEARRYADELKNALLNAAPDITVERQRSETDMQDFGATLVLILGTPALVAAVNAVSNWLKMRRSASITFKNSNEEIIVKNISSKDAAQLAKLLLSK